MASVEGYEIGAVLFGSCGDQGVCEGGAADQPVLPLSNVTEAFFLVLLDGWDTRIFADLIGQDTTDFGMARDGGPTVLCWVVPPGMIAALSKKLAAVTAQVTQQLAALHRAMRSSTNCSPAAASASWRLNSIASARTSLRLVKRSALVRSWQLTPGTSSIQPIHQSPSCFSTAVYSAFINKVYDGGCPFSATSMPNSGLYSCLTN